MMPRIVRYPMITASKRDDYLLSQVTALMMNAQRYEMRAAGYLALGLESEAATMWQASDQFAQNAFALIDQALTARQEDKAPPGPPKTREEAMRREFPDAVELKEINPEIPDAVDNPEDGAVVNPEGRLLGGASEEGGKVTEEHSA